MNTILIQAKGVPAPIDSIITNKLALQKTHPAHFSSATDSGKELSENDSSSFKNILLKGIDKASELEHYAVDIAQQSQLDPSIDEHDVSIAAAKASMAVQLTRSIVDRALEAYRSIIALR